MVNRGRNSELSKDSLFRGDLACFQKKEGYRFSIDSVLLAHFCLHWKKASILDLGCGCGILGLILLYRNSHNIDSVDGIEIQESLVKITERNIRYNQFQGKFRVTLGDYKNLGDYFPAEKFTHLICNPPFYRIGSGRISKNDEAYLARHQIAATTSDIVKNIFFSLKNKGIASIIYPAEFLTDLLKHLQLNNIEPKTLRLVFSYPESPNASLVMIECLKNGGVGLKIKKPLYIYQEKNGEYTQEVAAMYMPQGTIE